MLYLGRLSGTGALRRGGEEIARASFDFEGFLQKPMRVTSSGEIRAPAAVLLSVFGRTDIQLLTDEGRLLNLRFSDKRLNSESEAAQVEVTGELPATPLSWRHGDRV